MFLIGAVLAVFALILWYGVRAGDKDRIIALVTPNLVAPVVVAPVVASAPVARPAPVAAVVPAVPPPPSFDIVRVSPGGDAVIAGRAAPGASVSVTDNGQEIGRAQATPQGQFVIIPERPLASGGRELALSAQTKDGPTIAADAPVLVVVLDPPKVEPNPAQPTRAVAPLPASPPMALALLMPPVGEPRLLQAPAAPEEASRAARFGLDMIDYAEHGAIRFAGNAPAGATVRLYVDDAPVGDAVADALRRWTLMPTAGIAAGNHRVRADLLGAGSQVAFRVELPFERAVMALAETAGGNIVVQPRANLWRIARAAYGRGMRYTLIYAANRGQIRNPDLIYPGQIFTIPRDKPVANP